VLNNLRALYQVMRDAKLSRQELDKVIHERLKAVLMSAYQHVPYYRKLMHGAGYDPLKEYSGVQDLANLSITTKQTLKEQELTAFLKEDSDISSCFSDATSGSTGIPIKVYRSTYERAVQVAKWLRVLLVNGYSPRHRVMSLTSPARLTEGRSIIQKFGLMRRLAVDYLRSPEEMVAILLDYKPHVLYGNRSHLDFMALELKRRKIQPDELTLQLLVGAAEVFRDRNRQLYLNHFGAKLVETYGTVEMGIMAYETQAHDGLHLNEDLTYFEFLDKQGKPVQAGEPGRVVVTDLTGKLMPFIRYDQGDMAIFEYRDGLRKIKQIIGRDDDYASLPDRTRRPFHDFYEVMDKYENIAQFRIVQKTKRLFQILIVADNSYLLSIRDDLLCHFHSKFPRTVSFEIVQVQEIEPDPSGKIRMLISEVEKGL